MLQTAPRVQTACLCGMYGTTETKHTVTKGMWVYAHVHYTYVCVNLTELNILPYKSKSILSEPETSHVMHYSTTSSGVHPHLGSFDRQGIHQPVWAQPHHPLGNSSVLGKHRTGLNVKYGKISQVTPKNPLSHRHKLAAPLTHMCFSNVVWKCVLGTLMKGWMTGKWSPKVHCSVNSRDVIIYSATVIVMPRVKCRRKAPERS